MALKNLTSAEMTEISKPWTTAKHPAHTLLAGIDEVKGLVPTLKRAHDKLLKAQAPASNANEAKLADLSARGAALDTRHDAIIRAIYGVLTAVGDAAPTEAERTPYLEARDALVPNGLAASTQTSWRDEAGQAQLVSQRAKPHTALLAKIKTPFGTLSDWVGDWKTVGTDLGAVEDERARLQPAATPDAPTTVEARNGWIRAVNALVANLDLADITDADRQTITSPLVDAQRKADRRGTKRGAGATDGGETTTPPVATGPAATGTTSTPPATDPNAT